MPLRLEIKKELTARSDRVKSVDIYPAEFPWVLSALYNGNVYIWDYSNNSLVKSFELAEVPVRCAKFIVRKQWFVAGTDDMKLRVYNYNTSEKVKEWDAHSDYIRFVEVHPNRPYILSCSDDMSIKLWDWEKNFDLIQTFEGHVHYVMMIRINPRDTNTFASASLDRSIKVWGLTASTAHFSLEGNGAHEKGVNCIDYYPGGDKPYLLSGADDRTVKIWDYQTKACLQTLEGHQHNVSAVCFHPRLPLIISASEDGTVRLWHSTTYRPESTLNYGLERAWALAPSKDSNKLAIGYDEGTAVIKLGNEKPVASLDTNTGKIIWAISHDIQTLSVKGVSKDNEPTDGDRISLSARDLGACEVYPQSLQHNSNGSFICVCGDGEFIIYTSQALRNKAFGSALDFVWSSLGTGDYGVRESISRVKIFKNFKEHKQVVLPMSSAEGLYGGACLGVRGADSVVFFDWEEGQFLRKIDVIPINVYWNEQGDAVVLACAETYFVLKFDRGLVATAIAAGNINPEEGVEGSFELESSISDKVMTGQWVGDCFLYTNDSGKLQYFVGGEVMTLCHLNTSAYLLGFVPREDRVFLIDKTYNVISYKLLLSVLEYQTAVVRKDFETANTILPNIPKSELPAVARFLESQGFKEEALAVSSDPDHKFELALDLKKLDIAHKVLLESTSKMDDDSTDGQSRWRRLGDLALSQGDVKLAQYCASHSGDLSGLLLLHSASGNKEGIMALATRAREIGRSNVAFVAYFITGQIEECIQLLAETGRVPEAAFMARTYMPSKISPMLELWKVELKAINEKAADALADPAKYPNLFPDLQYGLMVEDIFKANRGSHVPASAYLTAKAELELNLVEIIKSRALGVSSPRQQVAASSSSPRVATGTQEQQVSATVADVEEEEVSDNNDNSEADAQIAQAEARRLAEAEASAAAEAEARRVAEARAAADAEAKRIGDVKAAAEAEARRVAEVEARAAADAEAKRIAEVEAAAEAQARRVAEVEARAVADAEAKRIAEVKAAAEAEARRVAEVEARAAADAEAKRIAEVKAAAEAEARRVAEVEARAAADAEAKRIAEAKAADEAEARRVAEEEARAAADAEAKRIAEAKATAVVDDDSEIDFDDEDDDLGNTSAATSAPVTDSVVVTKAPTKVDDDDDIDFDDDDDDDNNNNIDGSKTAATGEGEDDW